MAVFMTARRREYELWKDIQDIIGDASCWPKEICRLFWSHNLNHWQRQYLTSFVYVNGLHPDVFVEWANLKCLCENRKHYEHIDYLLRRYTEVNYNLYAWNVTNGQYRNINGTVRTVRYYKVRYQYNYIMCHVKCF